MMTAPPRIELMAFESSTASMNKVSGTGRSASVTMTTAATIASAATKKAAYTGICEASNEKSAWLIDDGKRARPIIYRASVTEMCVPYSDPTTNHYWKSAFDAGEYGLGKLANAGQNLPLALQVLLTYPFTNQVLSDVKGDYLNIYLSLEAKKGTTVIPTVRPHRRSRRH